MLVFVPLGRGFLPLFGKVVPPSRVLVKLEKRPPQRDADKY
jgi:hypothetical protein